MRFFRRKSDAAAAAGCRRCCPSSIVEPASLGEAAGRRTGQEAGRTRGQVGPGSLARHLRAPAAAVAIATAAAAAAAAAVAVAVARGVGTPGDGYNRSSLMMAMDTNMIIMNTPGWWKL